MGANMADLYDAGEINGREWRYNRAKTATRRADHAEMRVTIPPEALPYLERLKEGAGDSWLPRLHAFASNRNFATARVNRCLAKWCKDNGIEVFTFYAARHTWATLARAAGVDKSTIDDCLGHKGAYQIADIYAEKAWHLMAEANAKVIAMFRWPEGQEGRKG